MCDLMEAIFSDAVASEFGGLCKKSWRGCQENQPSQRRHKCLMFSGNKGLCTVCAAVEPGIVLNRFTRLFVS